MKRVYIYRDKLEQNGKLITVENSLEELLNQVSLLFDLSLENLHLHSANNCKIHDVRSIRDEEKIYISVNQTAASVAAKSIENLSVYDAGSSIDSMTPHLNQLIEKSESQRSSSQALNRMDVVKALIRTPIASELRFQGVNLAGADLNKLDLRNINFKRADLSHANLEGAQLIGVKALVICLEQKKTLYVPVPRLQTGFLNRLDLPEGENEPAAIRKAVSRNGMETFGKPIGIEDSVSLDLVVMGSVAVSKEGYRIGKGRGYGDLEFGLIMHMKAVFDTLPAELFGPHDVPIDIIVTPTQVIETQRMSQRPPGIIWHLLSNRRLLLMPGGTRVHAARGRHGCEEGKGSRVRRNTRRRNSAKSAGKENKDGEQKPRRPKKQRPIIDFSVKRCPNAASSLKSWFGRVSVDTAIYISSNLDHKSSATINLDSVISALAEMSVGGSGGESPRDDKPRLLSVEPAPPRQPRDAVETAEPAQEPAPQKEVH
ncbi:hypothetical protein MSG28_014210 [Choristoneura fumiferana]|uniref:Uncharacterized protein n=2 Tax=Choristoneura fumiferana TaxID=7141 RepID=A0ACC0JGA8_CHOFU|nr:hypothetical protein MSG28_014210 [Choristoneura fumiferana]KAI8423133.1 hypothetical protein MSG28_014210 [Choristoneura fumiferana]